MFGRLRQLASRPPRKLAPAPLGLHVKGRLEGVVETFEGMVLSGWAAGPGATPVGLALFADSHRVEALVEKVHRLDVSQHLGGKETEGLQFGFRIAVPPTVWSLKNPDGVLALHLEIDGTDLGLPALPVHIHLLWAWLDRLNALEDPEQRQTEWQLAKAHFSVAGTPEDLELAEQRWAASEAGHRARDALPGARLKWAIEQQDELGVSGWAASPNGGDDHFEVECGGQRWPAPVVRFERSDVHAVNPWARLDNGFDLTIPVEVWQSAAPGSELEVRVMLAGRSLIEPPLQLSRHKLIEVLAGWRAAPQPVFADPAERRFRVLRMAEHLACAGALAALPEPDAAYLAGLAVEQQVDLGLAPASGPAASLSLLHEGIWLLQRAFNQALPSDATGPVAMQCLLQVLEQQGPTVSDSSRHRFTVSMVPYFCSLDALDGLRPQIDPAELEQMAHGDGRWELSLLLPVSMLDELVGGSSRLDRTATLMERLARTHDRGWLNTAAVLDAWRRLARAPGDRMIDDSDRARFIEASLALMASIGHSHASRLHDEHLARGMWHLLTASKRASDSLAGQVEATAVRLLGLVPAFWQAGQDCNLPAPQDFTLQRCHQAMAEMQAGWSALERQEPGALDTCCEALAVFRQLGCAETDSLQRHLLLLHAAVSPPGPLAAAQAERLAVGLPDAERLRWPARRGDMPSVDLLRRHAPAPPVASSQLRQAVRATWPPDISAALALAGELHRFTGLVWLGEAAHAGLAQAHQMLPQVIDTVLEVCTRHRHLHAVPPAALAGTLAWLGHDLAATPRAALHARAVARTRELWPGDELPMLAALPAEPRVRVRTPALTPVVVLQCAAESDEPHALPAWVGALTTHGIPWILWRQDALAPKPAEAHGSSADGGCTVVARDVIGLLEWLVDHCDFGRVLVIDLHGELAVETWLQRSGDLGHHYHGLVLQAAGRQGLPDKTPPGTRFVRAAHGLTLSRYACLRALGLMASARGSRLRRGSSDPEKYLGDLLSLVGIQPSDEGHVAHLAGALERHVPGTGYLNFFPPGPEVPTVVTQAGPTALEPVSAPGRLWPLDVLPSFDPLGRSQQLVQISPAQRVDALNRRSGCLVVAVLRNERHMVPHFLRHYRELGAAGFVMVDNLSTDGSRDHLLAQDDVVLYSADTAYSAARYGVSWQQAVLAAHGLSRWSVVVDLDELLVWPTCRTEGLTGLCHRLEAGGFDAARAIMVDMYPAGELHDADLATRPPFEAAPFFDGPPAMRWRIGSGSYSNGPTWVSGLRHRLMPHSPPNFYTSQKLALLKYSPWVRASEGLHYASGLQHARESLALAHFKYHKAFHDKVTEEVTRGEHYNGAEEYKLYQKLLAAGKASFFERGVSSEFISPESLARFLNLASD